MVKERGVNPGDIVVESGDCCEPTSGGFSAPIMGKAVSEQHGSEFQYIGPCFDE